MGKLFPSRRRKTAPPPIGPHGTGGLTGTRRLPQPARFAVPRRGGKWRGAWRAAWPWLLAAAFIGLAVVVRELPTVSLPHPFATGRQDIPARAWQVCGAAGAGSNCVVDGDTVHIAGATVRLAGLDTPELAGACEAERIAARVARDALAAWLSEGPFTVHGDATDKYGRPLRTFTRGSSGAAEALVAKGVARSYEGGRRAGWCGPV